MYHLKKIAQQGRSLIGDLKRRVMYYQKPCATILMYHSIDYNEEFFTVSPDIFKLQMQYLFDNGYSVVSLADLLDDIKKGTIRHKTVAITFDDGYQDNYLNAYPILKSFNFPATIFVATGYIGGIIAARKGSSLKIMTWEMLAQLNVDSLITIEPHTVTHYDLSQNDDARVMTEIKDSKQILEKNLGKRCEIFAAPYGRYSSQALSVIKSEGFAGAVTVDQRWVISGSDVFSLPRQSIDMTVSISRFRNKL